MSNMLDKNAKYVSICAYGASHTAQSRSHAVQVCVWSVDYIC